MARFGSGAPWWRVLRHDGSCADVHRVEQEGRLKAEGVRFKGDKVEMQVARWRP